MSIKSNTRCRVSVTTAASNRIAASGPVTQNWCSALSARERFIGTWKLVSWKIERAGGTVTDSSLGSNPTGWIMYQRDGHMSVNLMRSGRIKFASNNLMEATSEEIKSAFESYVSYCGSYEVNATRGFVMTAPDQCCSSVRK